ncbi:ATP12 family chaperone protein [Acetobacter conturbans]|uniref:ATPase n=1 Tax=Acetobacter conturbans TaxID=1737472 RepID=A0ABX0K1J2_9PROT|nr:ATP12 family protein [Acetobacter conturbans]NHN88540.1 hypothetical protein [Acetobacter conturbans]
MSGQKRFSADGPAPRRRFWTHAAVEMTQRGFAVTLDGKPVMLPDRSPLEVHSRALADALAAEWQAAGADDPQKRFGPDSLPLTRIAGTMIERVMTDRQHSVTTLAGYGEHDLLCYRAEAQEPVHARQTELWQPWLDWLRSRHGVNLAVTNGMMPITQSPDALAKLQHALSRYTDAELAGLGVAVPALGSLTLGMAVAEDALEAERAVDLATLDEQAQMQRWGEDPTILDRIALVAGDVADAARFMELAREK